MQVFPTLQEGSSQPTLRRTHIQTLQRALLRAGFNPGPVSPGGVGDPDGFFAGSPTSTALKAFQNANGIPANGTVGPETWEALPDENMDGMPTLALGSESGAVAMLQRVLRDSGFDPGPINGVFGQQTDAAVRGFQGLMGIVVDGVAGDQTWTVLNP
ncbi:peptidoglycan-binding domain-containing protein [Catellatospora tritici]|uniref:peptidoglycan-binding domain-containing protein n=1 Tax=Catellatospora tritici TaxID=2851566 RepID=UPI001C2DC594|nr:peptidoglycan-binding protein [Catellatospora tritici]MBV1850116.1 peptidoglycan-binding protein [Catellatospora tritici]